MTTVCREEIASLISDAFAASPLSGGDLVAYAADHGARRPVVEVLGRLHRTEYWSLRDLWAELADVPVEL